jgi:hypothetical protein
VGGDGNIESQFDAAVFADADFALQSATTFGITGTQSLISQQVGYSCGSSSCEFPKFSSLAVCSQCADVTPFLQRNTEGSGILYIEFARDNPGAISQANSTEYRLPNGLFVNNVDQKPGTSFHPMVYLTMQGTTSPARTVAMSNIDTLIWSQSIIKVENSTDPEARWPDFGVSASECALYYCVRNYTSAVVNGTLVESSKIRTDAMRSPDSWEVLDLDIFEGLLDTVVHNLGFHSIESIIPRSDLSLRHSTSNSEYNVSQDAVNGISAFMQRTFAACVLSATEKCTKDADGWGDINGYLLRTGVEQHHPSIAKVLWETEDFNTTFENIAASMSNAIRNGADASEGALIPGRLGVPTTVYVVNWWWITLHCLIELVTVLFLVLTALVTSRASRGGNVRIPVWKTSSLAILSRARNASEALESLDTVKSMEEKAKRFSVVLLDGNKEDDQGVPLVERAEFERIR